MSTHSFHERQGVPFFYLDVVVDDDAVRIRYFPLTRRVIPLADIVTATAREYRPIRDYGGWGIKGWSRRRIAYNLWGHKGVELMLQDGRSVLIGSQRATELEAAIGKPVQPS